MKSDPQLREDIRQLQRENDMLREELRQALAAAPQVVERVVTRTVTAYKDSPKTLKQLAQARAKIAQLTAAKPAEIKFVTGRFDE